MALPESGGLHSLHYLAVDKSCRRLCVAVDFLSPVLATKI